MAASQRAIRAGRAIVEFGLTDKGVERGLRRLERRFSTIGRSLQRMGTIAAAAGGAITGAFAAAAKTFAATGDQFDKMSARTGIGAQTLSELGFAAEQGGASIDQLDRSLAALARFSVMVERNLSTATDVLDLLGVSVSQFQKANPDERFLLLAQAISEVEEPTLKAGLALKVFGRSGRELLPMLEGGRASIESLRLEARQLGITMGDEDAKAAAVLTDALNAFWRQTKQVTVSVGAAVAGPLTQFLDVTKAILRTSIDWTRDNRGLIQTVAAVGLAVAGAGGVLISTGLAFQVAAFAAGGLASAIGVVGTVVAAVLSPLGLVAAGVLAAVSAFVAFTETGANAAATVISAFGTLKDFAMRSISAIGTALAAGDIQAASRVLWASLNLAWREGTQTLQTIWIDLVRRITGAWHTGWAGILQLSNSAAVSFSNTWDQVATGWLKIWKTVFASFEVLFLKVKELTGSDITGEIERVRAELDAALFGADFASGLRQQQRRNEGNARLDAIGDQLAGRLNEADTRAADKLEAARKVLEGARREWQEATTAAQELQKATKIPDLVRSLAEGIEVASDRTEARGIFNIAALQSLQGGRGTVDDEILEETKRGRKAQEETAKNTKNNKLVIGP